MNHTLLALFAVFAKIGAFTFGGGYAMIPLIQRETADRKHWISPEEILDVIAIAESTPGPIAINAATFIGYKTAGMKGAVCATLGVVLPSFLIISVLSMTLQAFQHLTWVRYAFFGMRAGILALILKALWSMFSKCPKNLFSYCIMLLSFFLVAVLRVNAILAIGAAAVCGIVHNGIRRAKT